MPRGIRPKDIPGVCGVCATPFTGYSNKVYCGRPCKRKAYGLANRDKIKAAQRRRYVPKEREGRPWINPHINPNIPLRRGRLECARLLAQGFSNQGIADTISMSLSSVRDWIKDLNDRYETGDGRNTASRVVLALKIRADPMVWLE